MAAANTKPTDKDAKAKAKDTDRIPHYSPVCTYCRHWRVGTATCDAFPKDPPGIPMVIFSGANKHKTPMAWQRNNVVFEVAPGAEAAAKKAGLI